MIAHYVQPMTNFTSITMSYSKVEDRIHIALALEGDQYLRMWMTQRLARQLVVTLARHLEKTERPRQQSNSQDSGPAPAPTPVERAESLAREQAHAIARLKPTQPTIPPPDMPVWLIKDVRLTLWRARVGVQFSSDLDVQPAAMLNRTMVRQWLSMLHRQFVNGDWPLDVWPQWLRDSPSWAAAGITQH